MNMDQDEHMEDGTSSASLRVLVVDDDPVNCQILGEYLEDQGYEYATAADGAEAWRLLQQKGSIFHVILLDRMMPNLDGMAVMSLIQGDSALRTIPVIMQTAAGAPNEVQEGIEAGVFFYLTKPFEKDMLLAIVKAAARHAIRQREAFDDLNKQSGSLTYLQSGTFRVRTMKEVYYFSVALANACAEPERVVMGLIDLLINAVEHGNLGISYVEKTQLQETDQWEKEIDRRLSLPEYQDKFVEIQFERAPEEIRITIKDQGNGFDWKQYEEMDPSRALASHGRGIAMARALNFDRVEYQGNGNTVLCIVRQIPKGEGNAFAQCSTESAGMTTNL